jgi:hypothetical protein
MVEECVSLATPCTNHDPFALHVEVRTGKISIDFE